MTKYKGPAKPVPVGRKRSVDFWVIVVSIAALAVVVADVFLWRL